MLSGLNWSTRQEQGKSHCGSPALSSCLWCLRRGMACTRMQVCDSLGVGIEVHAGADVDVLESEVFGCEKGGLRVDGLSSVATLTSSRIHR